MNFADRCKAECTASVIFLFQKREIQLISPPDGYEFDDDCTCAIRSTDDCYIFDDDDPLEFTKQELLKETDEYGCSCALEHWHTEYVFLTREEGEAYGNQHSYNYRDGWRVFGVCSKGTLVELLKYT